MLGIILSLAYPAFETVLDDPLHVLGFIVGHFLLIWCIFGFIFPSWLDVFIIKERRDDWRQPVAPRVLRDTQEGQLADEMESASMSGSQLGRKKDDVPGEDLRQTASDSVEQDPVLRS
jgi:solute carrier family 6 GABA transporter-like protein 1